MARKSSYRRFNPVSGNPFPLYLNDTGGGEKFDQYQIDVYNGLVDDNGNPQNGISYTGTATVCLMARQEVLSTIP